MKTQTIKEIEKALRCHIDYSGKSTGNYLKIMDRLAINYKGSLSQKVSSLLKDYYKEVNVSNLTEALDRLRKQDKEI